MLLPYSQTVSSERVKLIYTNADLSNEIFFYLKKGRNELPFNTHERRHMVRRCCTDNMAKGRNAISHVTTP